MVAAAFFQVSAVWSDSEHCSGAAVADGDASMKTKALARLLLAGIALPLVTSGAGGSSPGAVRAATSAAPQRQGTHAGPILGTLGMLLAQADEERRRGRERQRPQQEERQGEQQDRQRPQQEERQREQQERQRPQQEQDRERPQQEERQREQQDRQRQRE